MNMNWWQVCASWVFPFHEAEQVLDHFRDRFIGEMNAGAVVLEILHEDIIDRGEQNAITRNPNPTEQNQLLYLYLKNSCTDEAFKIVCNIIIAVKGHPKMNALGKDMEQLAMEIGVCVF